MGALEAVAATCDARLTPDTRRALDLALRYFREAAPKHTADEEQSLFPRLRHISDAALQTALAQLDALEQDHRWAEPLHELVDRLGNEYLKDGSLDQRKANDFRAAVTQLAQMYRRHIDVEDRQVFPVAARVMTPQMKSEIAQEMASRRSLKPVVNL